MSKQAMKKMAESIEKMLPKEFGFTILVFPFSNPSVANYVSNANRNDMIKALKEAAFRLEDKQDFETPENNIY
jgi:hypothetical protein